MMRRVLLVVLLAGGLWFGLKDWVYLTMQGRQVVAAAVAAPDYSDPSSWALRPQSPPPGGWETPWGVDVFLLPPARTTPHGPGVVEADHAESISDTRTFLEAMSPLLSAADVYAPYYRHGSPANRRSETDKHAALTRTDITAAFQSYLATDNRQRGVVLVLPSGSTPAATDIYAMVRTDDALRQRFAGVLHLDNGRSAGAANAALSEVVCSEALSGQCVVGVALKSATPVINRLAPNLPSPPLRHRLVDPEAAAIAITNRIAFLSEWLDENAPKPAEPLGGFDEMESVDIAPIRRPGETAPEDETATE